MKNKTEEGKELLLDFTKLAGLTRLKTQLVPVIVQNADTKEVLLLAYANQAALEQSLREQRAVFWSTSRDELWVKGATSDDYLDIVDIRINCEQNSLLYRVVPRRAQVCHTKDARGKIGPPAFTAGCQGMSRAAWNLWRNSGATLLSCEL